jgi:SPP1 family predicted phage head-tail adaptor
VNPGKLRHRITIQQRTITIDAGGFETETWSDAVTIWAVAQDVSGREFYQAAAVQMENQTKFTVRGRGGLSTSQRIIFKGNIYQITRIDAGDYAGQHMTLYGRLIEPEGGGVG